MDDEKNNLKQYAQYMRKILCEKIWSDYTEVAIVKPTVTIYECRLAHKIFTTVDSYQSQALILTIHLLWTPRHTKVNMCIELGFLDNEFSQTEEENPLNPIRLFDHESNKVRIVDHYEELVDISSQTKSSNEEWLSRDLQFFTKFMKSLLPDRSFIEWLKYNVCNFCMSPYKNHMGKIKEKNICFRCKLINEVKKITDNPYDNCSICLEEITDPINSNSICGDKRHTIHETCYRKMISKKCPICRSGDNNVDGEFIFE